MLISDLFWEASLEDLKKGYVEEHHHFVCLLCGNIIEKGIIYPENDVLYEAEKYMTLHIGRDHCSVFEYLIGLNKKLTGLTDHQNRLLRLFYEGKSDEEIKQEMEVSSTSTIRNHRFVLKEKERQAKMLLTMMELLKEKDQHAPPMIAPHQTATMIDDRYNVTKEEKEKMVKKFFIEGTTALKAFPSKEKQKLVVLREITSLFSSDTTYTEKDVNEILKTVYHDYVTLRRYMIAYGFLDRKADGSSYWLKK
ncbi:DUF2087 domain-containing protein [Fictibacillus sp. KIGAM418]|uniref:DUF2087 domain-containing protein n=1 Tax=Fictibacillus marinisediminis TaxID=2878389 RepID=A0A9X1XJ82_9BACL|nr:DUF2087 domain-containing protein [Fictibacillus marinisediminis]MCK6258494.1 DUF2087 domain-containing protein [Fictibacillus marinisediminis]